MLLSSPSSMKVPTRFLRKPATHDVPRPRGLADCDRMPFREVALGAEAIPKVAAAPPKTGLTTLRS